MTEEALDPRGQTHDLCDELVMDVALGRGSGDIELYVANLIRAVLSYPAAPTAAGTPLAGWLDELERIGRAGARELLGLVAARRATLLVREGRLPEARSALAAAGDALPELRQRLVDIARAHLQIAADEEPDVARLAAIAGGDDELAAALAEVALAEHAARVAPAEAVAAWRAALPKIPGPLLDARVHALHQLVAHDDEQRAFLLRLLAEIHLGSGRPEQVLALAERWPGRLDPALIAEASRAPEPSPSPASTDAPALGLGEKIGCSALLLVVVASALFVLWVRFS